MPLITIVSAAMMRRNCTQAARRTRPERRDWSIGRDAFTLGRRLSGWATSPTYVRHEGEQFIDSTATERDEFPHRVSLLCWPVRQAFAHIIGNNRRSS
jgi:hypothetical protein